MGFGLEVTGIIDAAYDLDGGESDWLHGIRRAAAPLFGSGLDTFALTYTVHGRGRVEAGTVVREGRAWRTDPMQQLRAMAPGEPLRSFFCDLPSLATITEVIRRLGLAGKRVRAREEARASGVGDVIALSAYDLSGEGVMVGAALHGEASVPRPVADRWENVSDVLAAALRLRRALQERIADAEAPRSREGGGERAEQRVIAGPVRDELRRAAVEIDGTERRRGNARPEEALRQWRELMSGNWSLIDRFHAGGRLFLVARSNAAAPRERSHSSWPRLLSGRERQIAAFVARGHSNKSIADTLGLANSTVATHVGAAMRKLGVRSRVELINALSSA
jgi:DNA-binding CsgD family transcriptional regulator